MSYINDKIIVSVIFFLSLSIQLIVFDTHPTSISVDSLSYLTSNAALRPHGYDLFLILIGVKFFGSFIPVIIIQLIIISLIPAILFHSFKSLNKSIAIIVSVFFLFYFYPYVMAPQIMTESIFIFLCSLIIFFTLQYQKDSSEKNLFFLLLTIVVANEVRQSLIILYPAIIFIIFSIFYKEKSKRIKKHLIFLTIFSIFHINFGSLSIKWFFGEGPRLDNTLSLPFKSHHLNFDKKSINIAPFFMIHYMSQININEDNIINHKLNTHNPNSSDKKYFLSPENGKNSKLFFVEVKKLLQNQEFFIFMSKNRSLVGSTTGVRENFKEFSDASIELLLKDLIQNASQASHRWPQLIHHMYKEVGYKKTGKLMRGMIYESIIRYPNFFKYYLRGVRNLLLVSVFHDELYYYFVPDKDNKIDYQKSLDIFPLSPQAYSSWLYQMEAVIGFDNYKLGPKNIDWPYRNDLFYVINNLNELFDPILNIKESESIKAYELKKNKFALPNYIFSSFNRIYIIIMVLSFPILLFFSFFSNMRVIGILFGMSGVLIILISCLVSTGARHVAMFMIFLNPILVTGLDGIMFTFRKIFTRYF